MINVVDYDKNWPSNFETEKTFLESVIGEWVFGSIEHVGSTAVVGLAAKPVIDIMVGVKSLEASKPAIELLTENGYCFYPYKPDVMHWFCKPSPETRTHHLHLVPYKSPLWHERILFREHLRKNPKIANEYAQLKRRLASENSINREHYTQSKWPFIQKVLQSIMNT
ncbi:MAG: GrpB family protein [Parashewanella sp.]